MWALKEAHLDYKQEFFFGVPWFFFGSDLHARGELSVVFSIYSYSYMPVAVWANTVAFCVCVIFIFLSGSSYFLPIDRGKKETEHTHMIKKIRGLRSAPPALFFWPVGDDDQVWGCPHPPRRLSIPYNCTVMQVFAMRIWRVNEQKGGDKGTPKTRGFLAGNPGLGSHETETTCAFFVCCTVLYCMSLGPIDQSMRHFCARVFLVCFRVRSTTQPSRRSL